MKKLFFAAALIASTFVATANAAVQLNQNVTGGVLYGSGNVNGGYTTDRVTTSAGTNIELGLRAHVRFSTDTKLVSGTNIYGNFATSALVTDRATWNFDWAINTDYLDPNQSPSKFLSDSSLSFLLVIDYDPSGGTGTTYSFDPINRPVDGAFTDYDHGFGYSTTPDNAGFKLPTIPPPVVGDYEDMIDMYNVAQNSWNLTFSLGGAPAFNPTLSGNYIISLYAFEDGVQVAGTSIEVLVGNAVATPEAASIVVWSGFGALGLGLSYLRNKRVVKA
jgi:hypothetical protein